MTKISDVALKADVSQATVSRVIRNYPGVKKETRERVLEIIRELNYQPNALAQQLRTQETNTVIAIVPNIRNTLFHDVVFGIEQSASEFGYHVLIADMHNQISIDPHYINAIRQRKIDGVISISAHMAQKLASELAGKYPLVMTIQNIEDSDIPSVSIDNFKASFDMMTHLIRMGHRKIVHLSSNSSLSLYKDRYQSYSKALADNGIDEEPVLVRRTNACMQGGFDEMERLLAVRKDFTAIFAAGDTLAMGAINALQKNGIRVPEDCAVVGFDDIELARFWKPPLTTVRQPAFDMGRVAFNKLLTQMRGEPILNIHDILPHELILRESCGYLMRKI